MNIRCLFYHWWSKVAGYHESTVNSVMTSFYLDRYVTADESNWIPFIWRPPPNTLVRQKATDPWIEDNMDLDPGHRWDDVVIVGALTEEYQVLVQKLNSKESQTLMISKVDPPLLLVMMSNLGQAPCDPRFLRALQSVKPWILRWSWLFWLIFADQRNDLPSRWETISERGAELGLMPMAVSSWTNN